MVFFPVEPRPLIAVDLTNVREKRSDYIDLALRLRRKEPFTPGFALMFMEFLESLNLGVPIVYFHDHAEGQLSLRKPKKMPQDIFDAEYDLLMSYFDNEPEHPRHVWKMGSHRPKADYALAHLHNHFNAVLISRDNFDTELEEGEFERVEDLVQYGFHFDEARHQFSLTENWRNRMGRQIRDYFPARDNNPISIIDDVARSIYPLLDDRVKVRAAKERVMPVRSTKESARPREVLRPEPTRQPALLSLLAMSNWSSHADKRVTVMGRLFVADPYGYPTLRWVGSDRKIEVRVAADRIDASIREGDFVHVKGTLTSFGDSQWAIDEIESIASIGTGIVLNGREPATPKDWLFSKWGSPPWRRQSLSPSNNATGIPKLFDVEATPIESGVVDFNLQESSENTELTIEEQKINRPDQIPIIQPPRAEPTVKIESKPPILRPVATSLPEQNVPAMTPQKPFTAELNDLGPTPTKAKPGDAAQLGPTRSGIGYRKLTAIVAVLAALAVALSRLL
jgi:hypothetical protein